MRTLVTSRGVTLEILAIQTLLEKFEASARLPRVPEELRGIVGDAMPEPDAPTYDVKTITGKIETHKHDETTIETDAEKAAWVKYQLELDAYSTKRAQQQKRLVFLRGIRYAEPTDDSWVKAQEEIGITVPTDPTERKLHYIETEICGGVSDFIDIMRECTIAGMPEESRAQAEALFRSNVQRHFDKRPPDPQGEVESELAIPAGGSGVESWTPAAVAV